MGQELRYRLDPNTTLQLHGREQIVMGTAEKGYRLWDPATGQEEFCPFGVFVEAMKLQGTRIKPPENEGSSSLRLKGLSTYEACAEEQQRLAKFNLALCRGAAGFQAQQRRELGAPSYRASERELNKPEARAFIADAASSYLGERVYATKPRGGKSQAWTLYAGRTIRKHLTTYEKLGPADNPLDALVPLEHLKGRRERRLQHRLMELMQQAWEEVGNDTRKPPVSNVLKHLQMLIHSENKIRERNELKPLTMPSHATLKAFRNEVLTPVEVAIAEGGTKHARNKLGRGSTDIRALFPGEYVEIDECKASLISSMKVSGRWEGLTADERQNLEDLDKEIRMRFHILIMIDVATRMPLAWIISDQPKAEATIELIRMATRSKQYEADLYGCELPGAPAMGLGHIRNDNGSGLRNRQTVETMVRLGAVNTITRAYNSTDRPYTERMFGTVESGCLNKLHGYTGRRAGHLTGYDAQASGVINVGELYGILSRFLMDEYPRMRHFGVGMHGRRPVDVLDELVHTRGLFTPIDPARRRIVMGAKQVVTPTDEGVRVFGSLWFNSDEFQRLRNNHRFPRKVSVFIDPDNLTVATIVVEGSEAMVDVWLQTTAFADMTLKQVINLLEVWRKEDPRATQIHEDRLCKIRREHHDILKQMERERGVPRSYFTFEELKQKSEAIIAGAAVVPSAARNATLAQWTAPGTVTQLDAPRGKVFDLSSGKRPLDMTADEADPAEDPSPMRPDVSPATAASSPNKNSPTKRSKAAQSQDIHQPLGRPKTIKELK